MVGSIWVLKKMVWRYLNNTWNGVHTYFEFAAIALTQLPDKGPDDDHNSFSDVIARKGTFKLTLLAEKG